MVPVRHKDHTERRSGRCSSNYLSVFVDIFGFRRNYNYNRKPLGERSGCLSSRTAGQKVCRWCPAAIAVQLSRVTAHTGGASVAVSRSALDCRLRTSRDATVPKPGDEYPGLFLYF